MKSKLLSLIFFCVFCVSVSVGKNYLQDVWNAQKIGDIQTAVRRSGCQRHKAHGNNYDLVLPLNLFEFDNTVIRRDGEDLTEFQMFTSIKGARDARILLSPDNRPEYDGLAFEIAIANGENGKYTSLRSRQAEDTLAYAETPNLLSGDFYTDFKILVHNGTIVFGKRGESPIFTYTDQRLKTVKYFALASWSENYVKFLYDCPIV